jgi:glycosyltransferase involved in cell wall biosynthesis
MGVLDSEDRLIRVLMLTRYGEMGASSRVRMLQYCPWLKAAGFRVTVSPFFDDAYLRVLYRDGRRQPLRVAQAYVRRLVALAGAGRFDLIWVEKEVLPFLPGFLEGLLPRLGVPVVVDYDDALFHRYDLHPASAVRQALGRKLVALIRGARLVTAGSPYLVDYARSAGAPLVEQIPTVVDLARYPFRPEPASNELRIGWIGSPSTSAYLALVGAALAQLAIERAVRLVTVGAGPLPDLVVPLECHPWSETTEASLLATVHIGIMPLPDEPWERGKCGYKLIQYMACGRPVVASPVGVNRDIVTSEVGFLADKPDEWLDALRRLAEDSALRQAMGAAGRCKVESGYSLEVTAPRLVRLLQGACG